MRGLITFLTGMTAGVGLVRLTEGLAASQVHLLEFYFVGAVVGLAAAGICLGGYKTKEDKHESHHR